MNSKVRGLLGISAKAGAAISGAFAAEKAIKEGRACLVLIAQDAAENAQRDYSGMCKSRSIAYRLYGDRDELGAAIGKDERVIIVITDEGLAASLISKIDNGENNG